MRPIVIVPACTRDFGEHPYHAAQHKYVDAVTLGADCASLILPSSGESLDLETIFGTIDGIMNSGNVSALRQFQRGRGLRESGVMDNATLGALGITC